MSKIVIISDTHGNQAFLRQVLSREMPYTHLFHLGDNFGDLDTNPDLLEGVTYAHVPGIYHPKYRNHTISPTLNVTVEGWHFTLVHAIQDARKLPVSCDFICFGHTHKWFFKQEDSHYLLNPGHLKERINRNQMASYCIIVVSAMQADVTFYGLDGKAIHHDCIVKNREEA